MANSRHWSYVQANFWLQKITIISFEKHNYHKNCSLPLYYLPTREKIAPPYTSLDMTEYLLSDRLWAPLL